MTEIVFVELIDEGTPTWLAVPAMQISENVFKLNEPMDYDPEDYTLQFKPGSLVLCQKKMRHDGSIGWFAVSAES